MFDTRDQQRGHSTCPIHVINNMDIARVRNTWSTTWYKNVHHLQNMTVTSSYASIRGMVKVPLSNLEKRDQQSGYNTWSTTWYKNVHHLQNMTVTSSNASIRGMFKVPSSNLCGRYMPRIAATRWRSSCMTKLSFVRSRNDTSSLYCTDSVSICPHVECMYVCMYVCR